MNQTEQLLNRYGLTLTNKEYAKEMRIALALAEKYFHEGDTIKTLEAAQRKNILYTFFIQTNGVYIGDLTVFKKRFLTKQANIHYPDCLWGIAKLYVQTNSLENPFTFGIREINKAIEIIDLNLEQKVPELQNYLKRYRLQDAFKPDEYIKSPIVHLSNAFISVSKKLDQTNAMKELNIELMEHLCEKFRPI